MEISKDVVVTEKYKIVEPFSIVMPSGEASTLAAYESDTTMLLAEDRHCKLDVMQRMKDHARETSELLTDQLRTANKIDGAKIRETEEFDLRLGTLHAKPAAHSLDARLQHANKYDILEPGLDIYSTIRCRYDGPYENTESATGYDKGGYQGAEYSIGSESSYQPAEYKSVYDS